MNLLQTTQRVCEEMRTREQKKITYYLEFEGITLSNIELWENTNVKRNN